MNDIVEEIKKLKKEKNAVILAHYYVDSAIQDIADYLGDSYYLSKIAIDCPQDIIVFAGVEFMGESAKLLNPDKIVLMPDIEADCLMAHMVSEEFIRQKREEYDDLCVVCYINSTARIKTLADVCVTSSNAKKIVEALPNKNILFIPDQNLGRHIAKLVPEKNFIFCDGHCPIHYQITPEDIKEARELYPSAAILIHPECRKECVELADYAGSTSEIIDFASNDNKHDEFIVITEIGVIHEMEKKNPNKKFYPVNNKLVCLDMKKNTLEKIRDCLKDNKNQVNLDHEFIEKAKKPLIKMHELAK